MSDETIVGCWQMTEAWNIDDPTKPNQKTYPWGQPPLGYWVYDPAGNVSVQISINPPLPLVDVTTPNWWDLGPIVQQSMTASFDNYLAYFGTYTVDYKTGVVTHNVVTDVLRAYTGTPQPRNFKFVDGDLVIYQTDSYLRRFKRVAAF